MQTDYWLVSSKYNRSEQTVSLLLASCAEALQSTHELVLQIPANCESDTFRKAVIGMVCDASVSTVPQHTSVKLNCIASFSENLAVRTALRHMKDFSVVQQFCHETKPIAPNWVSGIPTSTFPFHRAGVVYMRFDRQLAWALYPRTDGNEIIYGSGDEFAFRDALHDSGCVYLIKAGKFAVETTLDARRIYGDCCIADIPVVNLENLTRPFEKELVSGSMPCTVIMSTVNRFTTSSQDTAPLLYYREIMRFLEPDQLIPQVIQAQSISSGFPVPMVMNFMRRRIAEFGVFLFALDRGVYVDLKLKKPKTTNEYSFRGGYIKKICTPCLYTAEDGRVLASIDFNSYYTNLMCRLRKGVSSDLALVMEYQETLLRAREKAVENGHQALARAYKLDANICYGMVGYERSPFFCPSFLAKVTANGRSGMLKLIEIAEQNSGQTVYAHTDGAVFLFKSKAGADRTVSAMSKFMPIKVDGVYRAICVINTTSYVAMGLHDDSIKTSGTPDHISTRPRSCRQFFAKTIAKLILRGSALDARVLRQEFMLKHGNDAPAEHAFIAKYSTLSEAFKFHFTRFPNISNETYVELTADAKFKITLFRNDAEAATTFDDFVQKDVETFSNIAKHEDHRTDDDNASKKRAAPYVNS